MGKELSVTPDSEIEKMIESNRKIANDALPFITANLEAGVDIFAEMVKTNKRAKTKFMSVEKAAKYWNAQLDIAIKLQKFVDGRKERSKQATLLINDPTERSRKHLAGKLS